MVDIVILHLEGDLLHAESLASLVRGRDVLLCPMSPGGGALKFGHQVHVIGLLAGAHHAAADESAIIDALADSDGWGLLAVAPERTAPADAVARRVPVLELRGDAHADAALLQTCLRLRKTALTGASFFRDEAARRQEPVARARRPALTLVGADAPLEPVAPPPIEPIAPPAPEVAPSKLIVSGAEPEVTSKRRGPSFALIATLIVIAGAGGFAFAAHSLNWRIAPVLQAFERARPASPPMLHRAPQPATPAPVAPVVTEPALDASVAETPARDTPPATTPEPAEAARSASVANTASSPIASPAPPARVSSSPPPFAHASAAAPAPPAPAARVAPSTPTTRTPAAAPHPAASAHTAPSAGLRGLTETSADDLDADSEAPIATGRRIGPER